MRDGKSVWIAPIIIAAVLLGVWEYVGLHNARFKFLLATPSEVVAALWTWARSGEFFVDAGVTGAEALLGLLLGTVIGTVAGLMLWLSTGVAAAMRPVVSALGGFPVFAIAPLMIVWFGVGVEMKVAFATVATVFVAFSQAYSGARGVSKDYVEVMRGLGASRWLQFRAVIVPASIDWVLAALRVNTGLALFGAFIGEFVAADRGLGYAIGKAAGLYQVPRALAGAFGFVILAALFNWLAGLVEKHRIPVVQYLSVPRVLRAPV